MVVVPLGHLWLASRGKRDARNQPRNREPQRAHPLQRTQVATAVRIERRPAPRASGGEGADVLAAVGTTIRICHALIQAERPGAAPPRQCRRACLTVVAYAEALRTKVRTVPE
jgi:hypothetical protein